MHKPKLPLSSSRILLGLGAEYQHTIFKQTQNNLLTTDMILRHSCAVARGKSSQIVANLISKNMNDLLIMLSEQFYKPYAMLECKRVGIEEGIKKGPQTIEKAKQGAYVARIVSSMHKVRLSTGELHGLIYKSDKTIYSKPYVELIKEIVASNNPELLRDFILTVGIVSNHGNWFTSEDHNKELKVLAQSYDWLLFLTDKGLAEFITEMLLKPIPMLAPARKAFFASYDVNKKRNRFTKVLMDLESDKILGTYFKKNKSKIESWFNIIGPKGNILQTLNTELSMLRDKNWKLIHSI